uniref:CCHC-type domain-containing protein n=1 Tax=Rhinolophus ferrumequinum TaxID=59479 RepID=A0A671FY07_RHIFE
MGHASSKDLYVRGLKKVLAARGSRVSKEQLDKFLEFVKEVCPWFPDEGTISLETWEKIGERLQDYYSTHGPQRFPVETFGLWTLIRDCLDLRHEGYRLEKLKQAGSGELPPHITSEEKGGEEIPLPPEELINLEPPDEQWEDLDPGDKENLEEAAARYERERYSPLVAVAQEDKPLLDTVHKLAEQMKALQSQIADIRLKQEDGSKKEEERLRPPQKPYYYQDPYYGERLTRPLENVCPDPWNSGGKDPPVDVLVALPPPAVPPTAPPNAPLSVLLEPRMWGPPLPAPQPPVWDMPIKPPPGYVKPGSDSDMQSPLQLACEEGHKQGDNTRQFGVYPLFERVDQAGRVLRNWRPFQWKQVKELKEACSQYGPIAPFTVAILDALAVDATPPEDWKHIAHACLSGGDYLLWKSEFYENCKAKADENRLRQIPVTFDMLAGEGMYSNLRNQLGFAPGAYAQTAAAAKDAWRMLPDASRKEEQVTQIRQGADEPFQDFVSRLNIAAGRTFGASTATQAFIKQLAYENANSACQAIIRPIKKKGTIADFIRLCTDVGPSFSQGVALAAALQGKSIQEVMLQQAKLHVNSRTGACFTCGKTGHRAAQCPRKTEAENPPAPAVASAKKPPNICPKCRRGKHWANECKSKIDKDGNPVQGNWVRGQPQAPTQQCYGALQTQTPITGQAVNQSQKENTSQIYSGPPQAAQDWTCVPPPTSY